MGIPKATDHPRASLGDAYPDLRCHRHWAASILMRRVFWRGSQLLVSVRLLKEMTRWWPATRPRRPNDGPMIDPVSAARQLLTLVDREIRIARRVVFFTCTCGIFPTSSRPPRQRWTIWQKALRDKVTQRPDIPSLLVAGDQFVALAHIRPIVIGPADADSSVWCDYLD